VVVAALAVAGIAAACAPVTPPAPPPTTTTPPPAPVAAACAGLEVPTPTQADPVDYVAVVEQPSGETEIETFTATSNEQVDQEVAALEAEGEVVTVTEDLPVTAQAVNPDDEYFYSQWGLRGLPGGGFETAWSQSGRDGAGQVIAIVDTGIDTDHPEFAGRVLSGARFLDAVEGPDSADVEDDMGHGTHVAGIAAAADSPAGPGGFGLGGAPAAAILPVKVLNESGKGSTANVAAGIKWAAEHGATVINLSLGGGSCGPINIEVENARSNGVVVVAAAGNENTNQITTAPGGLPGVITVGATTSGNAKASFSNYGPYVELGAPGQTIWSTFPSPSVAGRPAGFGAISGTSMSTPFVSAAVALLRQDCLSLTVDQVAQILRQTATPMIPSLGAPLLNVEGALNAC
jgi:subtilisin family serine protease